MSDITVGCSESRDDVILRLSDALSGSSGNGRRLVGATDSTSPSSSSSKTPVVSILECQVTWVKKNCNY